jgi:hypothetical protein
MTRHVTFTSRLPLADRGALEALLFFNSGQHQVRDGIEVAIRHYGPPEIVEQGDSLRVQVSGLSEVQTLFAVAHHGTLQRPVGAVVYVRETVERFTIVHLVVAEDFAAGGPNAAEHVLLRLLQEIRRVARRTGGIREIELAYRCERLRSLDEAAVTLAGESVAVR